MHVLVCYDIVSNRRRGRLFRRLKGMLPRVQKSVFEGPLSGKDYPGLMKILNDSIDHETDTVRVFHLCAGCRELTDLLGTAAAVASGPEDVVVG